MADTWGQTTIHVPVLVPVHADKQFRVTNEPARLWIAGWSQSTCRKPTHKSEFRVTKQLDTCSSSPHEGMHFCWREQNNCWLSSQPMSRAGAEKFLWSCRAELMERGTYSDRVRTASPTGEVHATNVCTHGTERLFWQTYKPNGICYASGIWQHSTQRHCVSLHNTFSQTPPSARSYILLRFRPQHLNAVSEFGFVQYKYLQNSEY